MTCLACSSIGTPLSEEPKDGKDGKNGKDGKPKKATFRKRNKRFDDPNATIACDVCLRDIAVGGVLPLPLDAPDPSSRIDFMIEIVCASCDVKYKRCSDCGGGGGSRAGTGKWRCAELFPPQRKTCSLKHQRLGAFPAMEYSVYRNTDIPRDELDELSDTLRSMYVNSMLGGASSSSSSALSRSSFVLLLLGHLLVCSETPLTSSFLPPSTSFLSLRRLFSSILPFPPSSLPSFLPRRSLHTRSARARRDPVLDLRAVPPTSDARLALVRPAPPLCASLSSSSFPSTCAQN